MDKNEFIKMLLEIKDVRDEMEKQGLLMLFSTEDIIELLSTKDIIELLKIYQIKRIADELCALREDKMKQNMVDDYFREADGMAVYALRKLPAEAYGALMQIKADKDENVYMATRRFQQLCREYLSDDEELMRLIDEDEKEFPHDD